MAEGHFLFDQGVLAFHRAALSLLAPTPVDMESVSNFYGQYVLNLLSCMLLDSRRFACPAVERFSDRHLPYKKATNWSVPTEWIADALTPLGKADLCRALPKPEGRFLPGYGLRKWGPAGPTRTTSEAHCARPDVPLPGPPAPLSLEWLGTMFRPSHPFMQSLQHFRSDAAVTTVLDRAAAAARESKQRGSAKRRVGASWLHSSAGTADFASIAPQHAFCARA